MRSFIHLSAGTHWIGHTSLLMMLLIFLLQFVELHTSGKLSAILLLFGGLSFVFVPYKENFFPAEKIWLAFCFLFFISVLPSYFLSEDTRKAGSELEKLCKMLVISWSVLVIVRRARLPIDWFHITLLGSAFSLGGLTLVDLFYSHSVENLLYGNRILQGNLSIFLLCLLIGFIEQTKFKKLFPAAMLLCLAVSINSGSRSGWLALIPVLAFKLYFINSVQQLKRWHSGLIILLIALPLLILAAVPSVQERVGEATEDIEGYLESPEKYAFTSLGVRFELIRSGWLLFLEHPLTGVGLGDSARHFLKHDRYGFINNMVGVRNHFHNDFIQSLSLRGGFHTLILLMMLGWLLYYFFPKRQDTPFISSCRQAGFLSVLSAVIFSLSIPFLSGNKGIVLLTVVSSLLIYFIEVNKSVAKESIVPS